MSIIYRYLDKGSLPFAPPDPIIPGKEGWGIPHNCRKMSKREAGPLPARGLCGSAGCGIVGAFRLDPGGTKCYYKTLVKLAAAKDQRLHLEAHMKNRIGRIIVAVVFLIFFVAVLALFTQSYNPFLYFQF